MAKYNINGTISTTETGKKYVTTGILQSYIPGESDLTYTARLGDRWDNIAYRFYNNPKFWYVLARANGGADGSIFITPGKKIIIPETI